MGSIAISWAARIFPRPCHDPPPEDTLKNALSRSYDMPAATRERLIQQYTDGLRGHARQIELGGGRRGPLR
jgi:hypothetical protein